MTGRRPAALSHRIGSPLPRRLDYDTAQDLGTLRFITAEDHSQLRASDTPDTMAGLPNLMITAHPTARRNIGPLGVQLPPASSADPDRRGRQQVASLTDVVQLA